MFRFKNEEICTQCSYLNNIMLVHFIAIQSCSRYCSDVAIKYCIRPFGHACSHSLRVIVGPELSTGRTDPRVGSGRVTILPDFGGSGRVGSALRFFSISLIISWYLNRCESSNTTFGLIDIRYNN